MDKGSSKVHKQVALYYKKAHPDHGWSQTATHLVVFVSVRVTSWGTYKPF